MQPNKEKNLVSLERYGTMCGISRQAVYKRENLGWIEFTPIEFPDGKKRFFVDIDEFPPEPRKKLEKK